MPKTKTTSPARSQGGITTPKRKTTRGSRSLCSPALSTGSGRLTSIIDQYKDTYTWTHTQTNTRTYYMEESFALSPCNSRSVLNDNTEIEEPQRQSWWKKLDENSQDVMEVLEDNRLTVNNAIEELIDIEILSQEKNNYTLDIPESSDNESIKSIVLPQRRLFPQKERTQPQKQYGHLIENRESLAKLHNTNTTKTDKTLNARPRELFKNAKTSKIIFPAALLHISPNKTAADKTRENVLADPKPQVRNIFGNRPANKRKNMFADFILSESESENEIPEIQPKVFGFQKKLEQKRISSISKGRDVSPASSVTADIEMDFRMLLPSSTMVENQLEDNMLADNTPIKRARLSKLSEAKESEAGTLQTNTTCDKTKQSNKSVASKNKSKVSPELKDKSLNSSRMTRSMLKNGSKHVENVNTSVNQDAKGNKSRNKTYSKDNELGESPSKSDTDKQSATLNKSQKQNKSKTRNSPKAIETEIESEEIVINAINNVTRVINKSTNKSLPNTQSSSASTATNKSIYEKEHSVGKTESNDVKQNEKEDDENNFTLKYENDDNEVVEEAVVHNDLTENQTHNTNKHNTVVLESQETEINKSKSNKSFQKKPAKIVEESVESQTEQYSADDNVDGNQKQETENVQNKDEEMINEKIDEDANNSREDISDGKVIDENELENEVEVNVSQDNEEDANESAENEDEVNVSQENEEETNGSQEKAENENQEIENEVSEVEDEEEANESDENEDDANVSDVNEDEDNESQEIEGQVNESQEIEEEVNENQEVETEVNESQKDKEEVNESQEIDEEAHESQEVKDAHASDEENDEEMDEEEEETANESQDNEASANESQEVANDEQESHEVASEAESEEVEDDPQMDDSDEADKAIASDPEISDDNQADEMEVDGNAEQESDSESEQNEHESREDRQNEIEPSEEIEEPPNVTHDTTGRHRKKDLNKSAEVILHNNTNFQDSFTVKGRNTSVRKTKSITRNLNIEQSIVPSRDSITFQDGTSYSSAEGSGWDSHRITRKTLRQTFGKDFTPRKSLRALVMEKSAKRQTGHLEMHSETVKFPLANSTEMPEDSNHHIEDTVESDHEASRIMRLTTLEMYLQKIKEQNMEKNRKMEAAIRNSFKKPTNSLSLFKVPDKPAPRRPKPAQNKPKKKLKSIIPFNQLPLEVIEDMKYKPPKRFHPTNASWITKRLYKFLEDKLDAKYNYRNRIRAEKLVETIYDFTKNIRRHHVAPTDAVDVLKHEFARLEIVRTHHEFYEFFHEFMPREVRIKVVPDIVNKIALPRHGVFSDILRVHTHT